MTAEKVNTTNPKSKHDHATKTRQDQATTEQDHREKNKTAPKSKHDHAKTKQDPRKN